MAQQLPGWEEVLAESGLRGWERIPTGGGCSAVEHKVGETLQILVTEDEAASIPVSPTARLTYTVGIYAGSEYPEDLGIGAGAVPLERLATEVRHLLRTYSDMFPFAMVDADGSRECLLCSELVEPWLMAPHWHSRHLVRFADWEHLGYGSMVAESDAWCSEWEGTEEPEALKPREALKPGEVLMSEHEIRAVADAWIHSAAPSFMDALFDAIESKRYRR